ncbi:MAG: clan AA aspartic protease [Myxococcaceae bacterium]|nr:clan AA aspartic protease [Myxococcaceae bacterium]
MLFALLLAACDSPKKKAATAKAAADAGVSHGTYESSIQNVREQLTKSPCDKELALKLGDYLNRAKDYAGADAWVSEYEKSCERWPRLLWVRQHACEQLENHACAAKTGGELIDARPSDSDYWWWRGQAEAKLGHFEKARSDYFQSMANKPTGFPAYRLAQFADEKLKRPCDGALLIQWWLEHGKRTNEDWVDSTRSKLWLEGACGQRSGKGKTSIAAPPNAPQVNVAVKVGKTPATLVLDERAGTTAVSVALAKKAGLEPAEDAAKVAVFAAGRIYEGPLVRVASFGVGSATATHLDVVVVDGLPEAVDGVVGLNALMQFQVKRTPKAFELSPLP